MSARLIMVFFSVFGCFACIKEWVIAQKTENAYKNAKPLVSNAPLPQDAPLLVPGTFPHEILDEVLLQFVNDVGRVDYQGLAKDREDLDRYTAYINRYSPESHPAIFPTDNDRLAYYINAFNSSVLLQVLDRYPVENIYEIRAAFFVETVFVLGGKKFTLHALETLLREEFQDPRIHFALNCAARGDPQLRRQAFRSNTLEEELEQAAKYYVLEKRNVDLKDGTVLSLSSMFDLFEEDFLAYEKRLGSPNPSLISYLNRYLPEEASLPVSANIRIKYISYNWVPNDQAIP